MTSLDDVTATVKAHADERVAALAESDAILFTELRQTIATRDARIRELESQLLPQVMPESGPGVARRLYVQQFPTFAGRVYTRNPGRILTLLEDLGIRGVRHRLDVGPNEAKFDAFFTATASRGIRHMLTIGQPLDVEAADRPEYEAKLEEMIAHFPGSVDAICGYNEPNSTRDGTPVPADWAEQTVDHQRWLSELGQRLGIRVDSPALHMPKSTANGYAHVKKLGDLGLGEFFDRLNVHFYPSWRPPTPLTNNAGVPFEEYLAAYQSRWGAQDKPWVISEAGYYTDVNEANAKQGISKEAAAAYVPRLLFGVTDLGGAISLFEFADDGNTGREETLGQIGPDYTPKPSFTALKALLAELGPDGSVDLKPVGLTVEGPPDLTWRLYQRTDGGYRLFLTRHVKLWDNTKRPNGDLPVEPVDVVVTDRTGATTIPVGGSIVVVDDLS